jgi:hypothetical protein
VQGEVKYVREYDPKQPGKIIRVPVDLGPLLGSGVLTLCAAEKQEETDLFVHYASLFRSDGEAMCIALAESRDWPVATDDTKAIRIAQAAGLTVICCPELVKRWADVAHPDQATLTKAIQDIELLAQFRPNPAMPEYQWWGDQLP